MQQIGEDTNHHSSDVNSTNTRHLSEKFQTLHQSSIASPLNPLIGIKTPAARAAHPAPRASHAPARRAPPAAPLASSFQDSTRLGRLPNGPTMPSTRRSLDQLRHGPSAYLTRISSAHNPKPAQAVRILGNLPRWAAPAPSSQKRPMVTKS